MRTTERTLAWAVATLAVAGGVSFAPGSPAAGQGCPVGQHEDTETPGFQCVPGWCSAGQLLDGVTGACVAAPGPPPPPLG